MFLDCLRRRNPELIEAAIRFHQFVTRGYTVGIAGLHGGEPRLGAIHDAFGRVADRPS